MGTFAYSTPLTPRPAARNGGGSGGNFELTPGDRRTIHLRTQMKVKLKKMSLSPKEIEDGEDEMSEDKDSGSRDEEARQQRSSCWQFFIFVYGCCPSEE
ncbi:hypothetical protein R6Z07F_003310 [Ovis aries]